MRRFFRFTVRDLLSLTLVVALGVGWFVHQRRVRAEGEAREQHFQTEADKWENGISCSSRSIPA